MRWLCLILLALAFVPAASAAVPNPCALLTNAEVTKAFGGSIESRSAQGNRLYRVCTWVGHSLGAYSSARSSVVVQTNRMSNKAFVKQANQVPGAVPLHGIGQTAYLANNGERLGVWQQGIVVTLSLAYVSSPSQSVKSLARIALKRL